MSASDYSQHQSTERSGLLSCWALLRAGKSLCRSGKRSRQTTRCERLCIWNSLQLPAGT